MSVLWLHRKSLHCKHNLHIIKITLAFAYSKSQISNHYWQFHALTKSSGCKVAKFCSISEFHWFNSISEIRHLDESTKCLRENRKKFSENIFWKIQNFQILLKVSEGWDWDLIGEFALYFIESDSKFSWKFVKNIAKKSILR